MDLVPGWPWPAGPVAAGSGSPSGQAGGLWTGPTAGSAEDTGERFHAERQKIKGRSRRRKEGFVLRLRHTFLEKKK